MAIKTRNELITQNNTDITQNINQDITGTIMNSNLRDNIDSYQLIDNIAITDPGSSDDSYEIGQKWINTTDDKVFICIDNTASSAKWLQVGSGAGVTVGTGGDFATFKEAYDDGNLEFTLLSDTTETASFTINRTIYIKCFDYSIDLDGNVLTFGNILTSEADGISLINANIDGSIIVDANNVRLQNIKNDKSTITVNTLSDNTILTNNQVFSAIVNNNDSTVLLNNTNTDNVLIEELYVNANITSTDTILADKHSVSNSYGLTELTPPDATRSGVSIQSLYGRFGFSNNSGLIYHQMKVFGQSSGFEYGDTGAVHPLFGGVTSTIFRAGNGTTRLGSLSANAIGIGNDIALADVPTEVAQFLDGTTQTEGRKKALSTVTTNYVVDKQDNYIKLDASSNTILLELLDVSSANHGQEYVLKAIDVTNLITVIAFSNTLNNILDISNPSGTTFRYTKSDGDFSTISVNDYIKFSGCTNTSNDGTFVIIATDSSTYVEVTNAVGVVETGSVGLFQNNILDDDITVLDDITTLICDNDNNMYENF